MDIVENITVDFQMDINFEQKNKNFEKIKMALNLGKFRFDLRDTQIIFFIELLEKMQQMNKQVSFDVEKKTSLFEIEEERQNKEDLAKEEKEKKEKKEEKDEKEKKEQKEKEKQLNELKKKEDKEKQKEEKKCELCKDKATTICFDCSFYLCDSCSKFLHEKKVNSSHIKEDIDPLISMDIKCLTENE